MKKFFLSTFILGTLAITAIPFLTAGQNSNVSDVHVQESSTNTPEQTEGIEYITDLTIYSVKDTRVELEIQHSPQYEAWRGGYYWARVDLKESINGQTYASYEYLDNALPGTPSDNMIGTTSGRISLTLDDATQDFRTGDIVGVYSWIGYNTDPNLPPADGDNETYYKNIANISLPGFDWNIKPTLMVEDGETINVTYEYHQGYAEFFLNPGVNIVNEPFTFFTYEFYDYTTGSSVGMGPQQIQPYNNGTNTFTQTGLFPGHYYYVKFAEEAADLAITGKFIQSETVKTADISNIELNGVSDITSSSAVINYTWYEPVDTMFYWKVTNQYNTIVESGNATHSEYQGKIQLDELYWFDGDYFTFTISTDSMFSYNVKTIQFETIMALNKNPVVTEIGSNNATISYQWNDVIEGEIYYQIYYKSPTTGVYEAIPEEDGGKGYFLGLENGGTWNTGEVLKPNGKYWITFSSIDPIFATIPGVPPVDGDEFYVEFITTEWVSDIKVGGTEANTAWFDYYWNSTMSSTIYYNIVYASGPLIGQEVYRSSFTTEDTLGWHTFNLEDGNEFQLLKPSTTYNIEFNLDPTFADKTTSFPLQFKTTPVVTDVGISEIKATSIKVTYKWSAMIYDPSAVLQYTLDKGETWTQLSSDDMIGNTNPTEYGYHAFYINNLKSQTNYSLYLATLYEGTFNVSSPKDFTTVNPINEATAEVTNNNLYLNFYWDPGISDSSEVWLWVGESWIDPYSQQSSSPIPGISTNELNTWINLTDPKYKLVPQAYNEVVIGNLISGTEYTVILTTEKQNEDKKTEIEGTDSLGKISVPETGLLSFSTIMWITIGLVVMFALLYFFRIRRRKLKGE